MLAEFVASIAKLATLAATPVVITDPNDKRHRWLSRPGQDLEQLPVIAPLREHEFTELSDLCVFLRDFPLAQLFVTEFGIKAILDQATRDEVVSMEIPWSDRWMSARGGFEGNVKDAIQFLTRRLAGCGGEAVADALRNIDFTRTSTGKVTVTHGRESLGKSVEAAVQQADRIPSEFVLRVPMFSGGEFDLEMGLKCSLDIDLENQRFTILLVADEVHRAVGVALRYVANRCTQALLHEELKHPVYLAKV